MINQGLFYLDWLMDHRKDFQWLVMERLGKDASESVDWSAPRLLCIARDFTLYDEHAIKQINRNIELIRYRHYGNDLLLLEFINATSAPSAPVAEREGPQVVQKYKTVTQQLGEASKDLSDRYEALKAFLLALSDDVQFKTLRFYIAFRRLQNFACVELRNTKGQLLVYVKVDPDNVDLAANEGFLRDVRNIGHYGTGDLEITISNDTDLERAKEYLLMSYEGS